MSFVDFNSLPTFDSIDGVIGKLTWGEELSLTRYEIKKGTLTKSHRHTYEQITFVLSGFYEMTINGQTELLSAGKMAIVPKGVTHSSHTFSDCIILDVHKAVKNKDFE